jgi:hypothetical protein
MRGEKLIVWVRAKLATALRLNAQAHGEREGLVTGRETMFDLRARSELLGIK